jgi:sugar transferase (PEP-CTERM/EpsH1 system associated)
VSELLFLSHRIPYPPDKGDKIRSYHLLKALAERHTVHLGTFIDDPADWQHVEAVRRLCGGETCVRPLGSKWSRARSLRGLLTGKPLTEAYYSDGTLAQWTRDMAARRPLAGVFAFSSSVCQYAADLRLPQGAVRVADFCDVDSDKWDQYSAAHGYPQKIVYAREARSLARAEAHYVKAFDATLVISEAEAGILRSIAGDTTRIRVVPNGVDTDYFNPARTYLSPFVPACRPIVFTGAMDYHPNIDGVCWFAREVLPAIQERCAEAVFYIVGSNPVAEVRALGEQHGVIVTGRVPDVRPYLAHSAIVVAPLRIARGVQNKLLEAMAMARQIVATENALQGLPGTAAAGVLTASDAGAMVGSVMELMGRSPHAPLARDFVQRHYAWSSHLAPAVQLFDGSCMSERQPGNHQTAAA